MLPMGRTGRCGDGAIEPAYRLLKPGQGFLGVLLEEIHQRSSSLFRSTGVAVAFEAVPVVGGDRQSFRQSLS